MVVEAAAVLSHGRALENNPVLDVPGLVLFLHAGLNITRSVADFQPALVSRVADVLIGVDGRHLGDFMSE